MRSAGKGSGAPASSPAGFAASGAPRTKAGSALSHQSYSGSEPLVRAAAEVSAAGGGHAVHAQSVSAGVPWAGLMAVGVHTVAYLLVMTLAAWVVYRKLGLAFLRTAWFNLDWVWAGALVITGVAVLLR